MEHTPTVSSAVDLGIKDALRWDRTRIRALSRSRVGSSSWDWRLRNDGIQGGRSKYSPVMERPAWVSRFACSIVVQGMN